MCEKVNQILSRIKHLSRMLSRMKKHQGQKKHSGYQCLYKCPGLSRMKTK